MKEARHGKGILCKQRHNIVVTKVKDITCLACRNMLQEDPSLITTLQLEPIFDATKSKEDAIKHLAAVPPICPRCGRHMKVRKGRRGIFY